MFSFFRKMAAQLVTLSQTVREIEASQTETNRSVRNVEVAQAEANGLLAARHQQLEQMLHIMGNRHTHLESLVAQGASSPSKLEALSPHLFRNFLPNDDAAVQKNLMATWRMQGTKTLGHAELMESGFRVFSQNDEDGLLLRLFTHIGHTNRYVIEIGSNCNGSDIGIPENLSANLIINHGWHGAVFELDPTECEKMRYFFARDHATKHFHWDRQGQNTYYSPLVVQQAVSPSNVNELLLQANKEPEPDLFIIDIDGGDYAVMQGLTAIRPRVIVVEFEKRFRERHSVVQFDRKNFSQRWQQSGTASLPAWQKLLEPRGYTLCAVGSCGFNAFFVRGDIAAGKLVPAQSGEVFDSHPIFSCINDDFWLSPDETWETI